VDEDERPLSRGPPSAVVLHRVEPRAVGGFAENVAQADEVRHRGRRRLAAVRHRGRRRLAAAAALGGQARGHQRVAATPGRRERRHRHAGTVRSHDPNRELADHREYAHHEAE